MPSRDVEINLIAHDRTGHGTRSAAKNLEQLARKAEKLKTQKIKTKVKTEVDDRGANRAAGRLRKVFARAGDSAAGDFARRMHAKMRTALGHTGRRSGAAFMAGFIKTVTFGQLGQGFAHSAIRAAPAAAKAGGILGVALAGGLILELGQALSAAVPLALGGLLLAPSVVFLLKQQTEGLKQIKIQDKRVADIKKQIAAAKAADARASGRSGDSAKAKQARQDHINDLKKTLLAEQNIRSEYVRQAGALNTLKAKAKGFLTFVSKPVKAPLAGALIAMGEGFDRLRRPFREFTAALGPALVPFANGVMNSLGSFLAALKPALPDIVTGFQEWGRVMPQITGSVGTLLARLAAHPEAVQGFADSFDTFLGTAGDVLVGLQNLSSGYAKWEALIRGGRTGQWGDEWTKTGTKVGTAAKAIGKSQLWILQHYDDMLQKIRLAPGPSLMRTLVEQTHQARLDMEADFAAMTAAKKKLDDSFQGKTAIELKADDTDFTAKIINAKKQLKTVKGIKARARIEADISHFRAQRAIVRAGLALLSKTKTKVTLRAHAKDVQSKITDINRKLKDKHLTHPQKVQLRADKRQAEATLRQLQGEINQLHGKKVDIWIKTHRATYYSVHGNKGHVPTNPKSGSGAPGSKGPAAGVSWQTGMLDGGGMSRTGGPSVNVAAPIVDTRVIIDGREIRAVARSTVVDENRRQAWRARVGRR